MKYKILSILVLLGIAAYAVTEGTVFFFTRIITTLLGLIPGTD